MPRKYSRRRRSRSSKRTTKKKYMRRPKSKKIRGGVTVRAQDLTRLPSDIFGEIREMHPLLTPKLNNSTLRHAVKDYLSSNVKIKRFIISKYGEIGDWDVSNVTDMENMFAHASSFDHVPRSVERLVEGACERKHRIHFRHIGHVPLIERLVERACALKHTTHIRHIGHVPII